jgi:hypothetical protein
VIIDQLEAIWDQILKLTAVFVVPDWNDVVGWLPVLLMVGVVGPLLSLLVAAWLWYTLRKPRVKFAYVEPTRTALLDGRGDPTFPTGEPHCPRDRLIYASGPSRCSVCGDPLRVICPKCLVIRDAVDPTCGNCGLSFTLKPVLRTARKALGPPPGGAAAA